LSIDLAWVDRSYANAQVFDRSCPSLGNVVHGEMHEFENGLFIGEDGFGLNDLTQRVVEGINGIGGVDRLTDIHGVS
jgi:hypothetical protein